MSDRLFPCPACGEQYPDDHRKRSPRAICPSCQAEDLQLLDIRARRAASYVQLLLDEMRTSANPSSRPLRVRTAVRELIRWGERARSIAHTLATPDCKDQP